MSSSPPLGEGEVEENEEKIKFGTYGDLFFCGCSLTVHINDITLHSFSCLYLQPFIKLYRITDPQIFISSGLTVPRSLSLRVRKRSSFYPQTAIYYQKMSELVGYKEDNQSGATGGDTREDTLTTPPPHILGIQIEESKPNINLINKDDNKHDSDEDSQQNGILSPHDDNSKGDAEKDKEESGSELNSLIDDMLEDKEINKSSSVSSQPGQEVSSARDSDASSAPSPASTTQAPTPPTISVRPMLDLMGNGRVKEEKIEEPFAALNDLVKNIPTSHSSPMSMQPSMPPMQPSMPPMQPSMPPMQPSMPPMQPSMPPMQPSMPHMQSSMPPMQHNMPTHQRVPESFQMMSSVPPPTLLGQGQQVSIQKRPAPQSFPPGITMTKQPRRDSESSSSSSQGPSSPRLPEGITLVKGSSQKQPDPVANMLATRGVSVMPSTATRIPESNQAVSITKAPPKPVTQILPGSNSALTITATPPKRNRPSPSPVTSIDLTDDSAPPVRRPPVPPSSSPMMSMMRPRVPLPMNPRGRPPAATCDVCDKVFANSEALRIHMQTHTGRRGISNGTAMLPRAPLNRPPGPGSFPGAPASKSGVFECEVCTARYQTQQQLIQHTQRFHPDRFGGAVGHQFGIPVVNLDDPKTPTMLTSLGIKYCVPLCDLQQSNGAPGHYAVPVIAMDGSINPAVCNLDHMNCSNLLPLGALKAIRRQ